MITFKQTITVSEKLVEGFAIHLGWIPQLTRRVEVEEELEDGNIRYTFKDELYPNPQTAEEFVAEKSKIHMQNFFLPFGEKLVAKEIAAVQSQAKAQIIDPIVNALTVEIEEEVAI